MFDLIVIGGGPGGYHSALQAAHKGLTVCLIEKEQLGGVCLNRGCIPTKTMLHSSKLLKDTSPFAVIRSEGTLDLPLLHERKEKVMSTLQKSLHTLMKSADITVINGFGFIESVAPTFVVTVGEATYEAKNCILATGSKPVVPPIPGVDRDFVYTSDSMLKLQEIPASLVVIGGGVIGLEMATFYADAGSSVTIIEAQGSIGGQLDPDIEKILRALCKKKGITILCDTTVTAIEENSVFCETKKGEQALSCDAVLLSVGRAPNCTGLGLEECGVSFHDKALKTDEQCRTSVPGLYAVGDINGKWLLAHTAYREAEVAVATILGETESVVYEQIPSVIYTAPEVASVGLTEAEAIAQGMEIEVKKRPLGGNGRFLAETHKERGLCKVVLSQEGVVLGVQLIAPYASEVICSAAILVQLGINKEQIAQLVLPHPTIGEILKETIVEG